MRTAELQLFVKIYDNPQYLLQKHNLLAPASAASQHSIISDSVHSPHCRVQMFDPATSLTRVLLLDYFLRSECIIPRGWSDNGIESYNTCTIHVLVFLRCRKNRRNIIRSGAPVCSTNRQKDNGNGSICYQNALNFTPEMCEKHKPETRVSERHKPGFLVWQNERVYPGPGFSKTRFSIFIAYVDWSQ